MLVATALGQGVERPQRAPSTQVRQGETSGEVPKRSLKALLAASSGLGQSQKAQREGWEAAGSHGEASL